MKKIFLLILSSFLLTNLYAQCDEYSISLEDENGITRSDGTSKYICLDNKVLTLTDKNVSQGTNPVYTWEIFGVTSSTTGNILDLNNALIKGLLSAQPITVSKKVDECSEIPSVSIDVYSIPTLSDAQIVRLSENDHVCNGESVKLAVVDLSISSSGHYITTFLWNHSLETSSTVDVNEAGEYIVSVQNKPVGASITDEHTCETAVLSYSVSSCTGTINEIAKLSIYPNPFSSSITLTNIPTGVEKIEVISVLGNVVESVENPISSIELGQELSTGTYFIYLYSTDGVQVEKVMKVN